MASDHEESGEGSLDRISARLDRKELSRVSMPDGGSVFRGDLATRALQSLGARAMTVDETIIVGDDFDPGNIEDQALYAHETYHVEHGDGHGGGGGDNFRDAEEIAARAAESMVIQRSAAGGAEVGYSQGAGGGHGSLHEGDAGGPVGAHAENANTEPDGNKDTPDPARGYKAMLGKGLDHSGVVNELSRRVVRTLDETQEIRYLRHGDNKGFA